MKLMDPEGHNPSRISLNQSLQSRRSVRLDGIEEIRRGIPNNLWRCGKVYDR
jgi:hypothetical protein